MLVFSLFDLAKGCQEYKISLNFYALGRNNFCFDQNGKDDGDGSCPACVPICFEAHSISMNSEYQINQSPIQNLLLLFPLKPLFSHKFLIL